MSGYLQTWFFVASFIPWFLIDRIGRRPLASLHNMLLVIVLPNACIASFNDKSHGSRYGSSSRPDLSGPIRYIHLTCCWNRRIRYAFHLPWGIYRWISGHCLGVSVCLLV